MLNDQMLDKEVENNYKIGDYVEYFTEHYNGGTYSYDRCYNKGCIVEINNDRNSFNVIKQYGGQIWYGVSPICKVSEEVFLSKFSIYDEFQLQLVKYLNVLPTHLQSFIQDKIETKKLKLIRRMINYVLENKFHKNIFYKHKFDKIKIDDEAYAIEWYVYNVLRMYEPYKIQYTIQYCYGATKLIEKFIKENINFMVNMQFCSKEDNMILLIQEKWLAFLYENFLIDPKTYLSRSFLISIKKLESILVLRTPLIDKKITAFVKKDDGLYKMTTNLSNLIDSKIIFTSKCSKYVSNKNSKCHKSYIINLFNLKNLGTDNISFEKISKLPSKLKKIDKPEFITTTERYLSYYINTQKNLIIEYRKFSIGDCSCDNYTLYCLKTKKLLGSFEFNRYDFYFNSFCSNLEDILIDDEF
jgi:hypothetical protein